jgi:uncharacterized protein DUF3301
MTLLITILVFALAIWVWLDSMRAREIATTACARTCQHLGVQFLDDTVVLYRLRLRRDALGRMQIYRVYRFEFTENGDSRHSGMASMLGTRLEELHLERPGT